MHHRRWLRTGNPLGRSAVRPIDRFDRFHDVDDGGCWPWTGALDTDGYGIFTSDGDNVGAHRWSYQHHVGQVPDGLVLDHLCCNRRCVNPDHLEPVTQQENIRRGTGTAAVNSRKGHCPQGHPYDAENTRSYRGRRYCRTCRRELQRRRRARGLK